MNKPAGKMTGRPQVKAKNIGHDSVPISNSKGTKSGKGDGKAKRKQSMDRAFPVKLMGGNTKPKEI